MRQTMVGMALVGAVMMLMASLGAGPASAQTCTYEGAVVPCATTEPTSDYAGAFEEGEPAEGTVPTAVPTAAPAAQDTPAAEIAFTGAESEVLAYVGSAMIATGALALFARRRLLDKS